MTIVIVRRCTTPQYWRRAAFSKSNRCPTSPRSKSIVWRDSWTKALLPCWITTAKMKEWLPSMKVLVIVSARGSWRICSMIWIHLNIRLPLRRLLGWKGWKKGTCTWIFFWNSKGKGKLFQFIHTGRKISIFQFIIAFLIHSYLSYWIKNYTGCSVVLIVSW